MVGSRGTRSRDSRFSKIAEVIVVKRKDKDGNATLLGAVELYFCVGPHDIGTPVYAVTSKNRPCPLCQRGRMTR